MVGRAPAAKGDVAARRAAFAALYDEHVGEVFRFVHRRCGDRQVAEDITQDVFLAAVRSVDDPEAISPGWLITAARNRLIDVVRRQDRLAEKLRLIRGADDDTVLDASAVDRVMIAAAMNELSIDHRIVLTLHFIDGHPVPSLAEELGRSVRSVEGLLLRAKRNLRQELGSNDG